jgi:ectoine hydroxylase
MEIKDNGYSRIEEAFSPAEVTEIEMQLNDYISAGHKGIVYEEGDSTIRGIHGLHLYDDFFYNLCSNYKLLGIAQQYLEEPCYVHQFKINVKQRMTGDAWPWHQDFIYWKEGDGIANPKMINIGLMLDKVDMLNGPLCFIPNSHKHGEFSKPVGDLTDWNQDLSKNLTYQIGHEKIESLIESSGVEFMTGNKGDIIVFDPLLAHCSSVNMSPKDRKFLLITYNAVSNSPLIDNNNQRPEFLCARNTSPLNIDDKAELIKREQRV